jgi:hypothetical protein
MSTRYQSNRIIWLRELDQGWGEAGFSEEAIFSFKETVC